MNYASKMTMAAVAVIAVAAPAQAEVFKMTMASSHATVLPWVGALSSQVVGRSNQMLADMGSQDRIEWTESYAGALYGFSDTLEAVGDGSTDAGFVGTLWEESKMPYQNVTYYSPFVTDDPGLLGEIFNTLHKELPFMAEAWEDENQVFLGGSVADSYQLYTNFPVNSIDDLVGKKILAPGPSGAWVAAIGAVPVNGALTTFYNQIETGVADGALTVLTGGFPLKLHEVAPHLTIANAGAPYFGGLAINKDTWEGASDDVRAVLTELGDAYTDEIVAQLNARYAKFYAAYQADDNVTITVLPQAERVKWANKLPDLAGAWAANLPHGQELLTAYLGMVRDAGGTPARNWDAPWQ
jgi:TRAP-type C4-dicarboxylate transport system substrate-binding protein